MNVAPADGTPLPTRQKPPKILDVFRLRPLVKPEQADKTEEPNCFTLLPDGSVALGCVTGAKPSLSRVAAEDTGPHEVARALLTRANIAAGAHGLQERLDDFTARTLCLPTGDRWREAVSTALIGDWVAPLRDSGRLTPATIGVLCAEARTIHRQLVPLWRRRTGGLARREHRVEGRRILLLETPCGEGLTLRDLLAESIDAGDAGLGLIPGDPRLTRVLTALDPDERAVVLALGKPGIASWMEAAEYAGADDPPAFGERAGSPAAELPGPAGVVARPPPPP